MSHAPRLLAILALCAIMPLVVKAAQVITVTQIGRAFSLSELTVRRGDVVRFVNADRFLHQVSVSGSGTNVVSDEQEPGKSLDVTFDKTGLFKVRCEIHPKMLLTVTVN